MGKTNDVIAPPAACIAPLSTMVKDIQEGGHFSVDLRLDYLFLVATVCGNTNKNISWSYNG